MCRWRPCLARRLGGGGGGSSDSEVSVSEDSESESEGDSEVEGVRLLERRNMDLRGLLRGGIAGTVGGSSDSEEYRSDEPGVA